MMIIKNGHVMDPYNHVDEITDLVIEEDKILSVGKTERTSENIIHADGCYVVPGLIDHHCHIYPLAGIGLAGEAVCFASGVTTAVDAGSTGCNTYENYRPFIEWSKLSIKAYIHACPTGLSTLPVLEDVNPAHWDEGKTKDLLQKYPDDLLGLKLRTSAQIVKEFGYEPLKKLVEMAERLDTHVMVHCTNPPGEITELLNILRPGDIMTHMYMNIGSSIVENGHVKWDVRKARERGILFEAADARAHFGFEVARDAIQDGFLPDILATDCTALSMHLRPTAFNMAMQISKYHELGIPFYKLIELCTAAPARQMGMLDKIGSLTPGHQADVAVFKAVNQYNTFGDRPYGTEGQKTFVGMELYKPMLTVKNGQMVYRDLTF